MICFCHKVYAAQDLLRIHFIDVGYGDAIFVEMPDKTTLLIDSGKEEYCSKIISYLSLCFKRRGVEKLNSAILTHPHKDHFGGFPPIIEKIPVDNFYFNSDEKNPHQGYFEVIKKVRRRINPQILRRGDKLKFASGKVELIILNPDILDGSTNGNAIVSWLKFGETSFLFLSDIQVKQQDLILELFEEINKSNFIQIPHHGGFISDKFIKAFDGKNFIVSTGPNEYGKPLESELKKLKGNIFRTDQLGTIIIESDGKEMRIVNE